jgi:hypothetical protein
LQTRKILAVSVDEFVQLGLRQDGTHKGVTKTKLRKAARLLPKEQPAGRVRQAS